MVSVLMSTRLVLFLLSFIFFSTVNNAALSICVKFFCLFIFERERESMSGEGQRAREAHDPKQAPGSELSAQSATWARTHRL